MKERPILFNGDMVRAILSGEKTQTRRMVSDRLMDKFYEYREYASQKAVSGMSCKVDSVHEYLDGKSPFGEVGDRLWVREAFCPDYYDVMQYRATAEGDGIKGTKWTPSIHMPRWASRITLEIVGVRVERLGGITDEDVLSEGFADLAMFAYCWNSIYKNWRENPWVWVVEFKRLESA